MKRDYRYITYWIAPDGQIWHGPFAPQDNLHWKPVNSDVLRHSDLPPCCVQISPLEAAQILEHRAEGLIA